MSKGRTLPPLLPGGRSVCPTDRPVGLEAHDEVLLTHWQNPLSVVVQSQPVGSARYCNGHHGHLQAGFYRITRLAPGPGYDGSQEVDVYGVLVFPVIVSDCEGLRVCQIVNTPKQCEHDWHYGPDRPAPGAKADD